MSEVGGGRDGEWGISVEREKSSVEEGENVGN